MSSNTVLAIIFVIAILVWLIFGIIALYFRAKENERLQKFWERVFEEYREEKTDA